MRAQATRSFEFPSDTGLLVDACVARVREIARLDDDAVLPPLPRPAPRRDVVILTKADVDLAGKLAPDAPPGDALGARLAPDVERIPPRSGRSRAAVAFCALVAISFGAAAFLASPAGRDPEVVRVTSGARTYASRAAHAVAQAARSVTR